MSGLYHRALSIIRRDSPAGPGREELAEPTDVEEITPEEREKVLEQIDEIVAQSRISVEPRAFEFTPKRKGGVLPALVNASALLLLAAGVLAAIALFNRREQTIVRRPAALSTAEGKLVEVLRREAQQQLSAKENEIADIQERLAAITQERSQLEAQTEQRLEEREQELRANLTAELQAERRRLESQGVSTAELEERLRTLEAEKARQQQEELERLRQQAEAERLSREQAMSDLTKEYQGSLEQAQAERERLQTELAARQAEAQAQAERRTAVLEGERAQAVEQLQALRQSRQDEQLVLDQILSFYGRVREQLGQSRFQDALKSLEDLRSYLQQDSVASLPAVLERRPVELFIVKSLEDLINGQLRSGQQDTGSLLAAAERLTSASAFVERGERLYREGDYQGARELYLSALAQIPAAQVGHERLAEIERIFRRQERSAAADLLSAGNTAYLAGRYREASERYGRALEALIEDRVTAQRVVTQLEDAGYRRGLAEQPEPARITELERELERARAEARESARQAREAGSQQPESPRIAELELELQRLRAQARGSAERAREAQAEAQESETRLREAQAEAQESQAQLRESQGQARQAEAQARALEERVSGLQDELARTQSEAQERGELVRRIGLLRERYAGILAEVESRGAPDRETMLSLLQAKLQVQRLLDSEPIRAQHPDLYDRLDRYLQALVDEKGRETETAILTDLNALLDALVRQEPPRLTVERYADGRDLFLSLLDRLEALLR